MLPLSVFWNWIKSETKFSIINDSIIIAYSVYKVSKVYIKPTAINWEVTGQNISTD